MLDVAQAGLLHVFSTIHRVLHSMAFLPALSVEELHRSHRVVARSVDVWSYFDVLGWLQIVIVRAAEFLRWDALGKTNPTIGKILEISPFTLRVHMYRLSKKLDIANRAQAASQLMRQANNVQA